MNDQLFFSMAAVTAQWRKLLNRNVRDLGVTQTQWVTMLYLHQIGDGLTQRELAREMRIENPTLVSLLDALERNKLLERKVSATDRRAFNIVLTPKGVEFMDVLTERGRKLCPDLLEGISKEELEATHRVLAQAMSNAEKL